MVLLICLGASDAPAKPKRWLLPLAVATWLSLWLLAFALAGPVWAEELTPQQEMERVTEIMGTNPQISNPNQVYPGDTVMVIIGNWRDRKPACLVDVARTADSLAQLPQALPAPADTSGKNGIPLVSNADVAGGSGTTSPWSWLPVAIALLALAAVFVWFSRWERERWVPRWLRDREDPDRYVPVLAAGLGEGIASARQVLAETQAQQPTSLRRPIGQIERGTLRHDGQARLRVTMAFGDGRQREVTLVNGERVARVTFEDGGIGYYRWACANGLVSDEVGQDGSLPAGWTFVADAQTSTVPVVTQPAPEPAVDRGATAPTLVATPTTNGHKPHLHRLVVRATKSRGGNTTTYTVESTEPIGGFDIPEGGGKVLTARPRQ